MPRKKITKKKDVLVDPIYNSSILAKLITKVMYSGKKNLAQQIVYGAMDTIQEKMKEDPLKVGTKAIKNVRPQVKTRSRRVGGATYQVPVEVRRERSYSLGIRWLVDYARERGGRSFREKLVGEIMVAYTAKGGALKKRETVHKIADFTRAFAHYRW